MTERLTQILGDTDTQMYTQTVTHARRKRRGNIGVAQKPKETRPEHTGVGVGHASPLGGQAPCSELLEIRNATHRSAVQGQEMAQKREHKAGNRREVELTWHPEDRLLEQWRGPSGTPNVCCPAPHL